jgi:serine/threonine-protein kinase HipA
MADLRVELYGRHIGDLKGNWRNFDFTPSPDGIEAFGLESQMLSVAVPLSAVIQRSKRRVRANFFTELLPEGQLLSRLAFLASTPVFNTPSLLKTYGRDVAGALQIWDPADPTEPKTPGLESLTSADIANLLTDASNHPLANRPITGKTSLAGMQEKIVLTKTSTGWNRALDGYPSTHILKPISTDFPSLIFDEEYGMRIARRLGLAAFDTHIEQFDGVAALVIERYDRDPSAPQGRIHQEDFNQALGASGNEKYQKYGGAVTLHRIAKVVGENTDDLSKLAVMTTLAVGIGNLDMHAKNLSLLHLPDGQIKLAPAYDVVPQAHFNNDGEMALAVNGKYRHASITLEDIVAEVTSWGLVSATQLITDTLESIRDFTAETPEPSAFPELQANIKGFTTNLLSGRSTQ